MPETPLISTGRCRCHPQIWHRQKAGSNMTQGRCFLALCRIITGSQGKVIAETNLGVVPCNTQWAYAEHHHPLHCCFWFPALTLIISFLFLRHLKLLAHHFLLLVGLYFSLKRRRKFRYSRFMPLKSVVKLICALKQSSVLTLRGFMPWWAHLVPDTAQERCCPLNYTHFVWGGGTLELLWICKSVIIIAKS